jgi:glucosamine--fructose-6-phosphate aminotransferase (isomerizing)
MDYYEAVASQPANLVASAASVGAAVAALDLRRWTQGTIAACSMGASSHAGHTFVHRLARHGRRATSIDASELISLGAAAQVADSFVFVSEGGRSRETIQAALSVPIGARLAITNAPSAPISEAVDAVVALGHGEDSKVYTVGYTATLQAFGLLAGAIDGVDEGDDWAALPDLLDVTLASTASAAKQVAEMFAGLTSLDFVGTGAFSSSATESALLFRESTRTATAAYETYQYLHGPMESLTSSHGCVLFGDGREVELARYLAGAGINTVLITSEAVTGEKNLKVIAVPSVPAVSRAILDIVPLQLIAGELSRSRGLGIDGFLYHQDDTKIDVIPAG